MKPILIALSAALYAGALAASPVTYNVDPNHTHPSFETDHMGGLSVWRGMFRSSSGRVIYDAVAHTGEVDISVDTGSVDLGHDKLSEHVKSADMLDAARFPTATYKGRFSKFNGDTPAEVEGELTLHGVTKPLKLTINSFMCKPHPVLKREVCGADASASLNRADFGINLGEAMGFKMDVKLAIQIEAIRAD
ncbi:MAG TPA: YceI family protein [Steroidobacteraceae bacterium]